MNESQLKVMFNLMTKKKLNSAVKFKQCPYTHKLQNNNSPFNKNNVATIKIK